MSLQGQNMFLQDLTLGTYIEPTDFEFGKLACQLHNPPRVRRRAPTPPGPSRANATPATRTSAQVPPPERERELCIDNLLVLIH